MIEFRVLGGVSLTDDDVGEIGSILTQPKRLALLAFLVVARPHGYHRRSTLLAIFWPEQDEKHGRWNLNQAIRHLRQGLGGDAIRSRGGDEVEVDPRVVWSDVRAFETACEEGRYGKALDLYRGDLLEGLHVSGCPEFERWLDDERVRLRRLAASAAWSLSEELARSEDLVGAAEAARRAVDISVHDEQGIRRLIRLLDAGGNRAAAVRAYERYCDRLREQLDLDPAPETQSLVERIKRREEARASHSTPRTVWAEEGGRDRDAATGSEEAADSEMVERTASRRRGRFLIPVAVLTAAAILVWRLPEGSGPAWPRPTSLAILPCAGPDGAPLSYLGRKLTEDVIAETSRSRAFEKVIAFPSVVVFADSGLGPEAIGAKLGVDAVVYCESVLSDTAETVRVQLVDRSTGALMWSDELEGDPNSVSDNPVGDPLEVRVAEALVRAAAPEGTTLQAVDRQARTTEDRRAREAYAEGSYLLSRINTDSVHRAIYLFNESIERDSSFVLPYLGRGWAYFVLGTGFGDMEPREAMPIVRRAVQTALAMDGELADAYVLLAAYELDYLWDVASSNRHLRRALAIDPMNVSALQDLAYNLSVLHRFEGVPDLHARAIELSPLSPVVWFKAARDYMFALRLDEALSYAQRGLQLAPTAPGIHLVMGLARAERGDSAIAIEHLKVAERVSGGQPILRARLGYGFAISGEEAEARMILAELKHAAGADPPAKMATAVAVLHIGLAEPDSAFRWTDIAVEQRSANIVNMLRSPAGRRLAGDPRYAELMERLHLPVDAEQENP